MFYNTGIATYIWVLTNQKPPHRRGKVHLIDASQWYHKLRKNLGEKNCELSDEDVWRICDTFLNFEESEQSQIFPNQAFGYWKITVERPLRLRFCLDVTQKALARTQKENKCSGWAQKAAGILATLRGRYGTGIHYDVNPLIADLERLSKEVDVRFVKKDRTLLLDLVTAMDEAAAPVIAKRKKVRPGDSHFQSDCHLWWRFRCHEHEKMKFNGGAAATITFTTDA